MGAHICLRYAIVASHTRVLSTYISSHSYNHLWALTVAPMHIAHSTRIVVIVVLTRVLSMARTRRKIYHISLHALIP